MGAPRLNKTAVKAVLDAMKESGVQPGEVRVMPDGGFIVASLGELQRREPINPADLVDMG